MEYPKVSIIILNWNGLEDTIECVKSIKKITYPNYKVIVVDNGSEGDDVKVLREKFRDYIHIIENDKNYGFAEGNNIGIRYVLSKRTHYVFLLNNDTVVVSTDLLNGFVEVSKSLSGVGALAPSIFRYDVPQKKETTNMSEQPMWKKYFWKYIVPPYEFPITNSISRVGGYTVSEEPTLTGAALFIDSGALRACGLFNEKFFCYGEEAELLKRMRTKGYFIGFVPELKILHKGARASQGNPGLKIYYQTRNAIMFPGRFASKRYVFFLLCILFIRSLVSLEVLSFVKGLKEGILSLLSRLRHWA